MVEPDSNRTAEISTYTCDSCGRVATSVRADKLSRCCGKTAQSSVEIATEIPIPKWRFGTDFIAVVCRRKVVDILLLFDRTSVHNTLQLCGMDMQGFVDNLLREKYREATDIEVKYGNNVYVVRMMDGAPHIMIPAMGCAGDSYLTSDEKQSILALARSTLSDGIVANASGQERGSKAQCSSTRPIGDESVGAAVERPAAHGTAAEGAVRRVWCDQCKLLSISGVPWHEAGCPNEHKVWNPTAFPLFSQDPDFGYGEWVSRTKELANGIESDMSSPVGAGTNSAKRSTTSPTWRIPVDEHEEPQLVFPFISEEERQRGFHRALYKARWATRGKTVTNAEIDALEQEYLDNLWTGAEHGKNETNSAEPR
jgi:hypothetical protein